MKIINVTVGECDKRLESVQINFIHCSDKDLTEKEMSSKSMCEAEEIALMLLDSFPKSTLHLVWELIDRTPRYNLLDESSKRSETALYGETLPPV